MSTALQTANELGDLRFHIRPSPAPRTREEVRALLGAIRRSTSKRCNAKGQGHVAEEVFSKLLEEVVTPKLRNHAFRDDARLEGYASGAVRQMVAKLVDERTKRGDEISIDDPELRAFEDPRALSEDDIIAKLDAARLREAAVAPGPDFGWQVALLAEISPSSFGGVALTTAFDRDQFWDRLRAFALKYTPDGAPSRAARARVLATMSCPPVSELALFSRTEPRDIVEHLRQQETSRSFRKRASASPVARLEDTLNR